jgi:hypothetical protein
MVDKTPIFCQDKKYYWYFEKGEKINCSLIVFLVTSALNSKTFWYSARCTQIVIN